MSQNDSVSRTDVLSYKGPGAGILGLYSCSGKLYAIVKSNEDPEDAFLWFTEHGYTYEDWKQVVDGTNEPAKIPLAFAGCPGVVFQEKLWLMGGSSYDPEFISKQVGYYSFAKNAWIRDVEGTDGESAKWPEEMGERMGHSIVVSPDRKQVWVMGGYDRSGGAKKDMWAFNGMKWDRLDDPSWEPRCLFGAAASPDSIWIGGGFATPGGATRDSIWKWDGKNGWQKVAPSLSPTSHLGEEDAKQYCACTCAFLDDTLYFFATYYDPRESTYESGIFSVFRGSGQWNKAKITGVTSDWALETDYCNLASVVYKNRIYTRRLARGMLDDKIHYFVRVR